MSSSLSRLPVVLTLVLLTGCQFDRTPLVPIYHGQIHAPRAGTGSDPAAAGGGAPALR